jgi:uncharacterized protein (TIGR02145 family)
MKNQLLFAFFCGLLATTSCSKDDTADLIPPPNGGGGPDTSSVTDINGNTYVTIKIGTQEWMQENLRTTKYNNGDVIPTGLNYVQWSNATTGAWTYYNDSAQYNNPYGKLYNWYAVADSRGLCPTGWHVPTDSDWNVLVKQLDYAADTSQNSYNQSPVAGWYLKTPGSLLTGNGLWLATDTATNNSSGFSGLPAGYCSLSFDFDKISLGGYWWSSTEIITAGPWARNLNYTDPFVLRKIYDKRYGFSVRCIKD